ncbi:MAG: alpha/beta fold hydrolase, partial [Thermosynechococcaceae cyanobacterium]
QQVSSVLMVSASPGLATASERLQRSKQDHQLALELESGCWPEFVQRWYTQPLFAPLRHHPDFESLRLKRQNNNPLALAQMLRGMGAGAQPSLWDALPDLTLPIHLVVGELDAKFCAINRAMTERCPAAQLTVVPNCGHAVHLEVPQILAAVLCNCIAAESAPREGKA